jgi:signal transduction histidine kinase
MRAASHSWVISRFLGWRLGHEQWAGWARDAFLGAVLALLATVARWQLDGFLGEKYPFAFCFYAVLAAAWWRGTVAGLSATVVGLSLACYLFIEPRHSVLVHGTDDDIGLAILATASVITSFLGGAMHRALAQLRAADRAKDEFLAMLGHELRNPLAALSSSAYAIKASPAGSATAIKALDIVERQAEHMASLLDDLLTISRIATGKLALQRQRFDLAELAADVVQSWRANPLSAQVTITTDSPALWLNGDRMRVAQILSNLIENAVKFSAPHQTVSIGIRPDGSDVLIVVADQGAGISPAMMEVLFEPFILGEHAAQRGLGIGLSMVRRLAEMHGGEASATSDGLGKGATFTIRLPGVTSAAVQEKTAPRPTGAQRILLVEDDEDVRDALKTVLALAGHRVTEAKDGASALEALNQQAADVALIDIGLPDFDGYELARRIRAKHPGNEMKLIAISGRGQSHDGRRGQDAGFDRLLVKPIQPSTIDQILRT